MEGGSSSSGSRKRRNPRDVDAGRGLETPYTGTIKINPWRRKIQSEPENQVNTAITIKSISNQPDLDLCSFTYDLSHFPDSLLLELLLRLPVKSIFRFKCVCKNWRTLISDPYFPRLYMSRKIDTPLPFRILYRYVYVTKFRDLLDRIRPDVYISPKFSVLFLSSFKEQQQADQFKVLGVSNGLILCCLLGPLIYYVCDPVTRQWVTLPRGGHNSPNRHPIIFGEGIVSRKNEDNVITSYKVVRVEWRTIESNFLNLETYSSETGEWTEYRLFSPTRFRLLKRGGGPICFNGRLHWFVYDHGMVAYDPYKDTRKCRLIKFPDERDVGNEYKYDGLYRLCDDCQGQLRYFEIAPENSGVFVFCMWVLKDYEKGEWVNEFRVTRSNLWSDDDRLSSVLMNASFIPLSFHPFDLDVVFMRCVEKSCIVSYNVKARRLDFCCHPVGIVDDLSWRVVVPFVLPIWPTPIPVAAQKAIKRS